MHNNSQPKNLMNVATASRCWAVQAGTVRKPWPHPYWPYPAAVPSNNLPQNRRDPCFGAGSANTQKASEQEP
jgi:hypothetical protein